MPAPAHWGRKGTPEPHDPQPMEMPAGMKRPETLQDIFARLIYQERQREMLDNEAETPEEADDFDLPESSFDLLDMSPYELPETDSEPLQGFETLDPLPESSEAPKGAENSSQEDSATSERPTPPGSGRSITMHHQHAKPLGPPGGALLFLTVGYYLMPTVFSGTFSAGIISA